MTEEELKSAMNRSIQKQCVNIYVSGEHKLDNSIGKILHMYGDSALLAYSKWLKSTKITRKRNKITTVFGC